MAEERWCGWVLAPIVTIVTILLAIVGGTTIALLRPEMNGSDWAAWVQAVGSIAAICAGFGYVYVQKRWQDERSERDRDDRAEVVAFRLSGWLSEVADRIKIKSETHDSLVWDGKLPQPHEIVRQWKLDVTNGIEGVMGDLHHLRAGSGDVAQLAFLTRYFDTFLEQAHAKSLARATTGTPLPYSEPELKVIYENVGNELKQMQQLHTDAERHLAPIVSRAVEKNR